MYAHTHTQHIYTQTTYIIPGPPERVGSGLDDVGGFPGSPRVPELDGAVVAAGGEVELGGVAPVQVVDARCVGGDVP